MVYQVKMWWNEAWERAGGDRPSLLNLDAANNYRLKKQFFGL